MINCGDIDSQEITRAMALQGAELVFCGSQSWAASGEYNLWMQQTRAVDNGLCMAAVHFPYSDVSQRSYVIDSYGYPVAATEYLRSSVATAEIDLDAGQIWFARSDKPGLRGQARLPASLLFGIPSRKANGLSQSAVCGATPRVIRGNCREVPCRTRHPGRRMEKDGLAKGQVED